MNKNVEITSMNLKNFPHISSVCPSLNVDLSSESESQNMIDVKLLRKSELSWFPYTSASCLGTAAHVVSWQAQRLIRRGFSKIQNVCQT